MGKLCPQEGGVFLLLTPFRKTIMAEDLERRKNATRPSGSFTCKNMWLWWRSWRSREPVCHSVMEMWSSDLNPRKNCVCKSWSHQAQKSTSLSSISILWRKMSNEPTLMSGCGEECVSLSCCTTNTKCARSCLLMWHKNKAALWRLQQIVTLFMWSNVTVNRFHIHSSVW